MHTCPQCQLIDVIKLCIVPHRTQQWHRKTASHQDIHCRYLHPSLDDIWISLVSYRRQSFIVDSSRFVYQLAYLQKLYIPVATKEVVADFIYEENNVGSMTMPFQHNLFHQIDKQLQPEAHFELIEKGSVYWKSNKLPMFRRWLLKILVLALKLVLPSLFPHNRFKYLCPFNLSILSHSCSFSQNTVLINFS